MLGTIITSKKLLLRLNLRFGAGVGLFFPRFSVDYIIPKFNLSLIHISPRVGTVVTTPAGKGTVVEQNLLRATVAVQMEKNPDAAPQIFSVKEVRPVRNEGSKGKKMEATSTESDRKS